jgi:hypothetical protein
MAISVLGTKSINAIQLMSASQMHVAQMLMDYSKKTIKFVFPRDYVMFKEKKARAVSLTVCVPLKDVQKKDNAIS